jgi:hypothetical protein
VVKQELNVRVRKSRSGKNLFYATSESTDGKVVSKQQQRKAVDLKQQQGKSSVVVKYEEAVCGMDLVSCALLPHMHVNHWGKSVLRTVQRRDVLNRTFSRRIEI